MKSSTMAPHQNQAILFISFSLLLFNSPSPSAAYISPSPSPHSADSTPSPASYSDADAHSPTSFSDEDGLPPTSFSAEPSPSPLSFSAEPSLSPESFSDEPSPSPAVFSGEPSEFAISSPESEPYESSSSPTESPNLEPDPSGTLDLNAPTSDPTTSPPISSTHPEIESICSKTDYPGLCLTAVAPFITNNVDHFSVLELAIRAVANHVKLALSTAKKFGASLHSNKDGSLSVCNENYDDALYNLQSAIDAIATRDTGTISSMLSAAITDFSTCADEISGKASPMKDFGDKLSKMTSNCLAIATTVK